ncbi:GNAT family N-acetyltransferase [Lewinella sp. W8]|uniref:GNAT family N-acetyltransferase n=1 Tax=Lewinella sp. W8 TaxID=2528208 RepID=UPI001068150F|nr:GNAT family N-acetyltransferase [Lewinella sp. W8]MTB50290.1 GNAT family N-acetyltransferase [Lewinella sp. W8]
MLVRELRTERLILRPFRPEDAEALYRLNGDPEVMRWLPKDEIFASLEEAENFLRDYLRAAETWPFARWAVTAKVSGDFLGWCGLREQANGRVDLGYRLLREHWGKGYATESSQAWLAYGFDQGGLTSIIARTAAGNARSQRTLEKLGFRLEGSFTDEDEGWEGLLYRCDRLINP